MLFGNKFEILGVILVELINKNSYEKIYFSFSSDGAQFGCCTCTELYGC